MKLSDFLSQELVRTGYSLASVGANTLAWEKQQAELILTELMSQKIGVLGGDVYMISSGNFVPTYDSWYCERLEGEDEEAFHLRSKTEALDYIRGFLVRDDETIVFSLIFSKSVDVEA